MRPVGADPCPARCHDLLGVDLPDGGLNTLLALVVVAEVVAFQIFHPEQEPR
ncbi:MAG: hypothetical protein IPJ14_04565 [Kineosporiaceae bacterium]|nr:hypothetical protein [Kineosporiaceae bacterium]MBK7621931.1 hypothetical protein [Kineosporiaceae bacterium]